MEEPVLSEEEQRVVDEGEAAGFLLDHPAFLLAIEKVRSDCAEAILKSTPDELKVRENLYNLSRGLSAVTEELIAIQARGISMLENAARTSPNADDQVQAEEPDLESDY